jgi:hypothetical protein
MNESYTCAVCGRPVAPDSDHVEIEAEVVWMDDRNDRDEYIMHLDCALTTIDCWRDPA